MKPGAEGGSLYVPGAGHFECRLTGIPHRERAENDWTAGAVRGVEKEWTKSREAKSLGSEVDGDG